MDMASSQCSTSVRRIVLRHTWVINDYVLCSKLKEQDECLVSSEFGNLSKNYKYYLKLYPEGQSAPAGSFATLPPIGSFGMTPPRLYLEASLGNDVSLVEYNVSVLNGFKDITNQYPSNLSPGKNLMILDFNRSDDLTKSVSPDGKLTIYCEVCVLVIENKPDAFELPKHDENSVANVIFDGMQFSDVTLVVGNTNFPAHRAFLAASSKVFAVMFDTEMKESQSNQIVIKDIKSNVIQEMLRYIYTGKICNLKDIAEELLAAADKYNLENLKYMCEAAIVPLIANENAWELLLLADLHGASNLKKNVVRFINNNVKMMTKTVGWENISQTHPHLLLKLYRDWGESQ